VCSDCEVQKRQGGAKPVFHMLQIFIRFLIGGVVVSAFALMSDVLKPKSFAGLFGAAPSVALATLALTVAQEGRVFAAIESRSMMAGAVAFFVYASFVAWVMSKYRPKALLTTMSAMPIWFTVGFAIWFIAFR